jgi:RNA polymerase sigma-54 factor
MAVELKQNLKLSQQLLMSPQIQQAIKILTLGRQELQEFIDEELRDNPCLEQMDPGSEGEEPYDPQQSAVELDTSGADAALRQMESQLTGESGTPDERGIDELLARFEDITNEKVERASSESDEIETPIYDRIRTESSDLHAELEEQLRLMHITGYELDCAVLLLQYLSDSGFLETSLEDIAAENSAVIDDLAYALELIQRCEPVGVGARSLKECLLLQLAAQEHPDPLARRLLEECWPEFEKQDVTKIARHFKAKPEDVKRAIVWIREHLDPRPARQFGTEPNQVATPDVYIFKRGEEWMVSLNEDGLPRLRISNRYADLLAAVAGNRTKDQDATKEKEKGKEEKASREFVNERVRSAKWILQAIGQRNKTILRVAEVILTRQKDYFEHGVESLRPLTLRAVADELGLHESTVSRTTTSKYVHTPRGLFELKYFFNTGLTGGDGQELANEAIKTWVAEYIKNEKPEHALSDQEIADIIEKEKNMKVARRTVAKYREALGILSSAKRKKVF